MLALTFIFSGFVKAVDPLGTQYKIHDYLTALGIGKMVPDFTTLATSVLLAATEFFLGICLLFLPSIMDFPLRDAIVKGVPEDRVNWDEGMTRIYDALSHDYVYHDLSHMMIFAANHDTERLGSIVRADVQRMKIITTLLATLRGIPQTYYGDELMFLNTDDRGDSAWRREFSGGWNDDAVNLFSPEGRTPEQEELYRFNSRLWSWRKTADVIHSGRTLHFLTRDNTYAYFRYLTAADDSSVSDAVFVYINNSNDDKFLPWSYYDEFTSRLPGAQPAAEATGTDVVTGQPVTLSDNTVVPASTALVVQF